MTTEISGELEVPRPDVAVEDAIELAARLYNVIGEVKELGSQQDRNFRFTTATGRYLLKYANPGFSYAELEAQNIAMQQLAAHGIAAPSPIASLAGNLLELADGEGGPHVRLSTFVEGEPLTDTKYLAPEVIGELGRISALTALALAPLEHGGLDRVLQWDLRRAAAVVKSLAEFVPDEATRTNLTAATTLAWTEISAVADELRIQPIHGDITDDNVVCGYGVDGRLHPFGVIDLGDVGYSWLVAEIAVTCSSVLHHNPHDPLAVLPAIVAFNEVIELSDAEIAAIWPLIVARGAVLAVSGEHQVATDPYNAYAAANLPHEWVVFDVATSIPSAVATRAISDALGRRPFAAENPLESAKLAPLFKSLTSEVATGVDFSTTSHLLDQGAWLNPQVESAAFTTARGKVGYALARYGEYRLTRSRAESNVEPATYALHAEIAVPTATTLSAPIGGTIVSTARDGLVLSAKGFDLHLKGVKPAVKAGTKVRRGAVLGAVARGNANRIVVQVCTVTGLMPPLFVPASQAHPWREVCPDPSALFGIEIAAPEVDEHQWLERRNHSVASVNHHYYADPPQIERGWRSHLIDVEGRSYLDMCNNVSSVGHSHPRIADAAERQWQLLNTNSRFHYSAIAEYSERLASLAPDGLDTVLLVNSGTEAVDLAIRIAQIYTGRETMISLAEAYHGWTMAADGVSASTADNPAALSTRPSWTRFLPAPNAYRGPFRGPECGPIYVSDAATPLAQWAVESGIAGFICEPVFGNGGGVLLPEGYLPGIYELVRAYGGLCIADEVQVGAGRLGHHFWGFEQQGVVPDIITIAKPFGNGHPLGAVITRRDIADSLAGQGALFSSAGGSPVSSKVGLTVLDIIAEEGLQQNAREVGDYLRGRLEELATRHPIIGAVHGMGLYLGLELVRDQVTLEPAVEETAAICNRLRDLGIIEQPASDRFNVLKIKPPICLSVESADFYVDTLDSVLTNGW